MVSANLELLRKFCKEMRCFLEKKLHSWQKFYTTTGRDGRDKFQVWVLIHLGKASLLCRNDLITAEWLFLQHNMCQVLTLYVRAVHKGCYHFQGDSKTLPPCHHCLENRNTTSANLFWILLVSHLYSLSENSNNNHSISAIQYNTGL